MVFEDNIEADKVYGVDDTDTEDNEKMAIILPIGQWYAPSAVINDAWYCMVLHCIAWYCMVLHGIAWYCMLLHVIAWCCMVLHYLALSCTILHYLAAMSCCTHKVDM